MSEYMEKHTVSRLVGAPPGYGTLKCWSYPFSCILLKTNSLIQHNLQLDMMKVDS